MSTKSTFVIVGAGLAGAKAAETLRAEGFEGRLLLLGEEPEPPYDRPPLSKGYLRGQTDRDRLHLHQDGFYAANDIELHPATPVRSIDPTHHQLQLPSGKRLAYHRLLLATGATPRRLPLPGTHLAGIHALRSRRDADTLAAAWHPRYRRHLRVQHWANARHQGPAAARSMLGLPTSYARLPSLSSDQYDLSIQYAGLATPGDRLVLRGDPATRAFVAFWVQDQRVVAGMHANLWATIEPIQALIHSGHPIDPARLADPDIPIQQLTHTAPPTTGTTQ